MKNKKLTHKQVIDVLMEVMKYLPESVESLPEDMKERAYWEKLSKNGIHAKNVFDVMAEFPAFTYMRPKKPSKKAWEKVLSGYMGIRQVAEGLKWAKGWAGYVPCERKPIKYWRDAYGEAEKVQRVRPEQSEDWLPNPHRGTTTFQRFQGMPVYPMFVTSDEFGPVTFPKPGKIKNNIGFIPRTTLTYCRWPWAWLEPKKGKFNWSIIDNTLKTAKAFGQTAQLRFQPFTSDVRKPREAGKRCPPMPYVNVPEWLWDTGIKWPNEVIFGGHEPDANDPLYLKHFGDFIRAFGARYDGHPILESIDMGYAGFWGEAGGNSTPETAAKLVDIYLKSFKKTQLLGMLGTPGHKHAVAMSKKTGHKIGFRADCIGDLHTANVPDVPENCGFNHTYDAYNQEIYRSGSEETWKIAPITMETCGNVATWAAEGYDFDKIIYEGYRYHMSVFMPKNVFYPEKVMEKMVKFDNYIGYRYVIRHFLLPINVKGGEKFKNEVYIDNVGCAPIYRPYKLAYRFTQGRKTEVITFKEDITKWLPGNKFFDEYLTFPRGFQRGEVKVALAIVNDDNKPVVRFASKGKVDEAGWFELTSFDHV